MLLLILIIAFCLGGITALGWTAAVIIFLAVLGAMVES